MILDEPTTHLDANARIEILIKLKDIARQKNITILASMHEIEIAYRISDKIIVLNDGQIIACNYPEKIFQNGLIDALYKNKNTTWNTTFGTLEIRSAKKQPLIHVVAGLGTGIHVYRFLARNEVSFSTGILDVVDVDYYLATSAATRIFSNNFPYQPLTYDSKVLEQIKHTKIILDTGFAVTKQTESNLFLLKELARQDIQILSLRKSSQIKALNMDAKNITMQELQDIVSELKINTK